MKEKLTRNLVRLSLPFGFAALLLVVLLCGLARATEAKPGVLSAAVARERNYPNLVDYQTGVSICQQTKNLVPNPGFERGGGNPWKPCDWYEDGPCTFSYVDPGFNSGISARVDSTPLITNCKLRTCTDWIRVEPGSSYDYSARVKANLVKGDAYLRIRFFDSGGDAYTRHVTHTGYVTDADYAWVRVSGSVTAPVRAQYARVEATLTGGSSGSVWFDDIYFGLATCLDISKRDYPDPVEPGQELTYTIAYTNTGREKATDVQIREDYDGHVSFISAQPPPSWGDESWDILDDLLPGDGSTITVVVQVANDVDEPSLVNCVEIHSDETVELVYTCIPTHIITDGCAVVIYPPKAAKMVEPGDATDYRLTLYNMGSCDGQAYLTATSSQGWDVTIAPSTTYTLPSDDGSEEVTVSPIVPGNTGSVTDVTFITAALACESPCTDTVVATATVTTIVVQNRVCVYLPLVLRGWPPIPEPPVLEPIDNVDGDGSYNVRWSASRGADSYRLEEATYSDFTGARPVYTGTNTHYSIAGRGAARYYYRVKACNVWGCSCWSNVKWVDVLWEHEPNNSCPQANGPIVSGLTYSGTFPSTADREDYFFFDLTTTHSVELWLTDIPCGCDYDLYLCDDGSCTEWDNCHSHKTGDLDEHILCKDVPAGRYHARVHGYRPGSSSPYHLRVVYR
jgi:uncharacterized repeat protein (TIGR01451 family)